MLDARAAHQLGWRRTLAFRLAAIGGMSMPRKNPRPQARKKRRELLQRMEAQAAYGAKGSALTLKTSSRGITRLIFNLKEFLLRRKTEDA